MNLNLKSLSCLGLGLLGAMGAMAVKKEKPNILYFLIDDMGWTDTGYQGSKFYETPNIDKLAQEGVKFTNAYVSHPRCLPSRYSIITGKYPARDWVPGSNEKQLKGGETTLAVPFKEAGYSTYFTGKWHLASNESLPEDQGFEINIGGGHAGAPTSYFYPYNVRKSGKPGKERPIHGLDDGVEGEYLTDRLTDETIQYLKKQHEETPDKPFLAYVSHYAVHTPFQAKEEYVKKFRKKLKTMHYDGPEYISEGTGQRKMRQDNAVYAAMIYSMDESLGRLVKTLKELGEYDNTIIILFSDNGGLSNRGTNQRQLATTNTPLKAGKGHLYEGGIREPMLVRWPGVTKAGTETDAVIIGSDFFPTMLDMAGLPLHPEAHLDGESFVWALKNKANPNPDRAFFWHSPTGRPHSTGDSNCSAVRQGDYKLMEFFDQGRVELYNVKEDISEANNLSEEMPKKTAEMLETLHNWKKEIDAFKKVKKDKSKKKGKGKGKKGKKVHCH
ncbi:sulfatase [Marinifilum breve]|uniref:Sulfatase n=1 Tax=Marinifilum breve TaxID=2184082 RepID=A0A2V4AGE3_9BACT|nr:sulfatase [Marinifilum breve]PXY03174.1 sulfatase [Marinifilum breve]